MSEWIYVDSSNVEAVSYDESNRELHVRFLSGGEYSYHAVPREIFDELLNSSSIGSFINRELKKVYDFSKVQ